MNLITRKKLLACGLLFLLFASTAFAQKMTSIKGIITDSGTGEPVPFATVLFKGTSVGTTTDFDGTYELGTKWGSSTVEVSCLGYVTQTAPIILGEKQEMNFALVSTSFQIAMVEVKAKKSRYKRRDNPAVDLMQKVIDHKGDNRLEAANFYEVNKYEKVEFDINNFDPEQLKKRRAFKKFQFLFDHIDTSELNGKPFLPFFIQESSSKLYYRKNPEDQKEFREGVKITGMEEYVDSKDLTSMIEVLYQNVNIYDNDVRLLDLSFMSPLNPLAITYYRFYIVDSTAVHNGMPVTKVTFYPTNNQNIAFKGDLYIIRDSSYAVVKADFGITRQINVNFVEDLKLTQEFTKFEGGVWAKNKDQLVVDFALSKRGTGVYGTRSVSYKDYVLNQPKDNSFYVGTEDIVDAPDAYKRPDEFWVASRHDSLTVKEQGIYDMIDTLQRSPPFRRTVNTLALLFTGYKAIGPVDIGPVANFFSFNPVEGYRMKIGGETNLKFQKKMMIGGYGAYGTEDKEFKFGSTLLYSFREDFKQNPKHYVRLSYQKDVNLVGQILYFNSPDNFFLSFQRGNRDRMLMLNKVQGEYFLETQSNLGIQVVYANTNYRPIGTLNLLYNADPETNQSDTLKQFRNSDIGIQLRFAPNEQYVQGRTYRTALVSKHPVFTLRLNKGMKDVLGGDYDYFGASFNILKRFYLSFLGVTRMEFETGKTWGSGVPYFLLNLPRGNQSYTYRYNSFNMMNYQEFVNDEYAWLMMEHNFNGYILNKIPLLRKLKLRESVSFKIIYGRLTSDNDPGLEQNAHFVQFLKNEDGESITQSLADKPYMEASAGIGNIFKVIQIDAVQRLNYLENPEVPKMFGKKGFGIRIRAKLNF